jgi:kynureninase
MNPTLQDVRAWDEADPLRRFRSRFSLPPGVIYLDGNSLGPLPVATAERVGSAMRREWGEGLIRSWNDEDWIGGPARVGAKIATLIGAAANEVVVADSTSVNLFKLLAAALAAHPGRKAILTETGNFPTDLYVAQGLAAFLPGTEIRAVGRQSIAASMDEGVAVVMLAHVHYKTAERWDMQAITAAAHRAGALMLWDLSHSAGAMRLDLAGCGADLAVGCGYKYLNGGPGAPAYLFVAKRLQAGLRSPLTGWMGHAAPFEFDDSYRPAPGIARFLCGTPPILGLLALEVGVDLAMEADLAAVEQKADRLWSLFDARVQVRCGAHGFRRVGPATAEGRGTHIAFAHPEGYAIAQALIERGVIGDFRDPDVLRFGVTPLYLGYEDVWRAVETLYEVMETGAWRDVPARTAGRVT